MATQAIIIHAPPNIPPRHIHTFESGGLKSCGQRLYRHYTTNDQVKELVDLGDIYILVAKVRDVHPYPYGPACTVNADGPVYTLDQRHAGPLWDQRVETRGNLRYYLVADQAIKDKAREVALRHTCADTPAEIIRHNHFKNVFIYQFDGRHWQVSYQGITRELGNALQNIPQNPLEVAIR